MIGRDWSRRSCAPSICAEDSGRAGETQSYRPSTPNPQADSVSVGVDSGLASTAVGSGSVSMGSAPSVSTVGCSASGLSLAGAIELVGETDRDWCTGREAAWGMLTRWKQSESIPPVPYEINHSAPRSGSRAMQR